MSIFTQYSILYAVTAMICTALVNWIQITFLQTMRGVYFQRVGPSLLISAALVILILIIIKVIISPFEKVIKRIQSGGDAASEDEKTMAIKIYRKMNIITSIATLFGYALGGGMSMVIKMIKGTLPVMPDRIIFGLIHSLLFGGIVLLYANYGLNEIFAKSRVLLDIKSLNKNQKTTTLSKMLYSLIIVSVLFSCSNVMMVSYGIIFRLQHGTVQNAMNEFYGFSILIIVLSLILCFGIISFVLHKLSKRIESTGDLIKDITNGKLSNRINITTLDDFGVLISNVNNLMDTFTSILSTVKNESSKVNLSSDKLTAISSTLQNSLTTMAESLKKIETEGTNQKNTISRIESDILDLTMGVRKVENHVIDETTSIQESSASLTEMTANINSVAELTDKADSLSSSLYNTSEKGTLQIKEAITAITEIDEASKTVQGMVRVIQQIASQTNLLSMNAAIEAAHAGKYGQGFAVVANEVRALAASSSKSTGEIRSCIKEMADKINRGIEAINSAGGAFSEIAGHVEKNKELIQTISNAMGEQRTGAESNLKATSSVVDDSEQIKNLVLEQRMHTENVEVSMKSVVNSSTQVLSAIDECVFTSNELDAVLSDIEVMIKENREAVTNLNDKVKSYNF